MFQKEKKKKHHHRAFSLYFESKHICATERATNMMMNQKHISVDRISIGSLRSEMHQFCSLCHVSISLKGAFDHLINPQWVLHPVS